MNFNLKFYSAIISVLMFVILFQTSTKAQFDSQKESVERQFELKNDCNKLNQNLFIFIGKVKEVTKFKKQKLSQPESSYAQLQEGVQPKLTVRFEVERVFNSKDSENKIKEIAVDVFSDDKRAKISFQAGESYLVYGIPRFYGKAEYSLKDNLIIYPNSIFQPVSQSQERIHLLENSRPLNLKEIFGVETEEAVLGGIISGKAASLPKPRYPEEAKAEKADGAVRVAILVDEAGNVIKAKTLCAKHQALAKASEEAAMQAKYAPTKISGKPVKIVGVIVYNFLPQ